MGNHKSLRMIAISTAAAIGFGLIGASTASAAPLPEPVGPIDSAPRVVGGHAYADGRASYGETASVTVDGLRIRTGPGTGHAILGLLYGGERVKLVGAKQDRRGQIWHKVILRKASAGGLPRGYKGWVTAAYLY